MRKPSLVDSAVRYLNDTVAGGAPEIGAPIRTGVLGRGGRRRRVAWGTEKDWRRRRVAWGVEKVWAAPALPPPPYDWWRRRVAGLTA